MPALTPGLALPRITAYRPSLAVCLAIAPLVFLAGCAPTFLQTAAAQPGSVWLKSGGVMHTAEVGGGATPRPGDRVQIAWEGRFVDGKVFTTTKDTGGAAELPFDSASPCFRDALLHMHVGGKARVVCPSDAAHGDAGPIVPDNTTLDFSLELLAVAGDASAILLPPGLLLKVLRPGSGDRPRSTDKVKVHYEGRLESGKVFDSSIARGEPATFPLSGVISCWRYALQKMRVGERDRLTCPPEYAYGSSGSPPSIPPDATLEFDVELISIER